MNIIILINKYTIHKISIQQHTISPTHIHTKLISKHDTS